ncbi:putative DNA helicase ino80 [Hamiltosporidium tvaerminnensis]|nr:putative DNA helicase ino80 [Hamiltosporidium tvaerminnensis]
MKHLTLLKKLFEEHNTPFPTPTELSTINQPTLATLLCDTTHTNNHPPHKSSSHTISTILKEIKTEIKLAENTTNIRTALSVNYSILIKSHILKTQKAILLLHSSTLSFYRKISGLCVREAKRAFSRTSRVNPLLKGKKLTKEISLYHRKTDKTEKDSKKKIEKEQIEKKKKDFEQKESERQSRKLNFLLTQTELFSHFIMHKKKEGFVYEKDSKEGGVSDSKDRLEGVNNSTDKQDPLSNSTNEQQGFNETTNEQHPFINSINEQHPFINSTDKQHPLSTNGITTTIEQHPFNNTPTDIPVIDTKSLADKEIARTQEYSSTSKKSLYTSLQQPNILTCKLKDYQLKGLNWLANLYDQGINGILADDMGLGKTVQAISFLAYLYETENITGPFLIVTPASTLHNWLQEFEKFLPSFKIVPYWGSILERKALRKNWYKSGIGITAGGVNNIKSGEGVSNSNKNNKGSKGSKGVNNSTNEQHPLSNSADKQHPVNDSSNTYHPLSKSTDKQHPFNNSSNTYHPLSNTNSNLHTNTFNCVVTSYQIIVTDEKYFNKVKWNYMILDEAQAIKSSTSLRWKVLLNIKCRNRLLLTGTPIQNSMQELWALLHFIMPTLFDSHDEFNDWFSKEIESSAESKKVVSKAHLQRLHLILQPFMLRREKKDVKDELGIKTEKDVFCRLSYRQRMLYYGIEDSFKSKGVLSKVYSKGVLEGRFNTEDNVGDLGGVEGGVNDKDSKLDSIKGVGVKDSGIKGVNNSTYEQEGVNNSTNTLHPVTSNLDVSLFGLNTEYDNKDLDCLMNMAMQLRKVCNHPNLFEKPEVKSGFNFNKCYFIGRPYVDKGVSRIEMCLPRIVREFVEEKRRGCYSQENKTFSISYMDNTSDTSHMDNTPNTSHNNNTSDISLYG